MYYVYVLYDNKRFYIGYTNNLKRRLSQHKRGDVKSTKCRGGLKPIFFEAFKSKIDAQRREKYFKTTKGKRALKNYAKGLFRQTLGDRLMAGHSTLNAVIGVRISVPQPGFSSYNNSISRHRPSGNSNYSEKLDKLAPIVLE